MPGEDQSKPKVLLIVTAAFGELFNAMYFALGAEFETLFALRDPMFALNSDTIPGKCYRYRDLADLLSIVEAEDPDVVCLFSAYLFVHDRIMQADEIAEFLQHLHRRGIKVATSDPFLGLASRLPTFDPKNPIEQLLAMPVGAVGEMLFGDLFPYLMKMASTLKRVPHLYVVDPEEPGDVQRMAFFNPHIRQFGAEPPASPGQQQDWVFILASSEYKPQNGPGSQRGILDQLRLKLLETVAEGARPVLIAPKACVEALGGDPSLKAALLLDNCDYTLYLSLLVGAEYVFYWNIFSASIMACIANCRPTFFFARGHVADANQFMFDKGLQRYYGGARLTYLEQSRRLCRTTLADHAAMQETELFKPFLENIRHLPNPDCVMQQLMEG